MGLEVGQVVHISRKAGHLSEATIVQSNTDGVMVEFVDTDGVKQKFVRADQISRCIKPLQPQSTGHSLAYFGQGNASQRGRSVDDTPGTTLIGLSSPQRAASPHSVHTHSSVGSTDSIGNVPLLLDAPLA